MQDTVQSGNMVPAFIWQGLQSLLQHYMPTRTSEFKFQIKEHCSCLELNPGLRRTKRLTYKCARSPCSNLGLNLQNLFFKHVLHTQNCKGQIFLNMEIDIIGLNQQMIKKHRSSQHPPNKPELNCVQQLQICFRCQKGH